MKEATRAYIYRIVVVLMALAVGRGLITQDEAPLWLGLALSVLGLGTASLAAKNTSTKP